MGRGADGGFASARCYTELSHESARDTTDLTVLLANFGAACP